jgi:hypothetical protein
VMIEYVCLMSGCQSGGAWTSPLLAIGSAEECGVANWESRASARGPRPAEAGISHDKRRTPEIATTKSATKQDARPRLLPHLSHARLGPTLALGEALHGWSRAVRTCRTLLPDINVAGCQCEALLGIETAANEGQDSTLDSIEQLVSVRSRPHACAHASRRLCVARCRARRSGRHAERRVLVVVRRDEHRPGVGKECVGARKLRRAIRVANNLLMPDRGHRSSGSRSSLARPGTCARSCCRGSRAAIGPRTRLADRKGFKMRSHAVEDPASSRVQTHAVRSWGKRGQQDNTARSLK